MNNTNALENYLGIDGDNDGFSFDTMDYLGRKEIADDIIDLLTLFDSTNMYYGSYSIAINGKWGAGKTYFINMFIDLIKKDRPADKVVYYNAWENDDSESTLLPLLYHIMCETVDPEDDHYVKSVFNYLKIVIATSAKLGAVKLLGTDSETIKDIISDGIDRVTEERVKSVFDEYKQTFNRKNTLQELLLELVTKNEKLWVFIDDLDRCRPEFALETLEDIKHFFNIRNIIFVFSTDIKQLSNTVKKTYGIEKDKESYIRKFFDYIYLLPYPNYKKYLETMAAKNKFPVANHELMRYLDELYTRYDYSLREVNQNIIHISKFYKSNENDIKEAIEKKQLDPFKVYFYFLVIRDKYPNIYRNIIKGKFTMEKKSKDGPWMFLDDYYINGPWIKHFLDNIQENKMLRSTRDAISHYQLFKSVNCDDLSIHMETVLK